MSIEPYRYANGETLGGQPEADPWAGPEEPPAPGSRLAGPRRGWGTSRLALLHRRATTDPDWATRSPESKRLLLALDRTEAMRP